MILNYIKDVLFFRYKKYFNHRITNKPKKIYLKKIIKHLKLKVYLYLIEYY